LAQFSWRKIIIIPRFHSDKTASLRWENFMLLTVANIMIGYSTLRRYIVYLPLPCDTDESTRRKGPP